MMSLILQRTCCSVHCQSIRSVDCKTKASSDFLCAVMIFKVHKELHLHFKQCVQCSSSMFLNFIVANWNRNGHLGKKSSAKLDNLHMLCHFFNENTKIKKMHLLIQNYHFNLVFLWLKKRRDILWFMSVNGNRWFCFRTSCSTEGVNHAYWVSILFTWFWLQPVYLRTP